MIQENAGSKEWAAKIEGLVRRAEAIPDATAKEIALDLLRCVMRYHAAALERTMKILSNEREGPAIIKALVDDGLVASVFLLHGLHPDDFETRVARAVDKLCLRLNPRGADVALVASGGGVVRLRYEAPRNGQISGARALIEDTIIESAPEALEIVIEGLQEPAPEGFVPLAALSASHGI